MPKLEINNIEVASENTCDPRFDEIEREIKHTAYEKETTFYTCIENGDIDAVESMIESVFSQSIVVGRMSNDELRQMKYFAVCCVTLATRYAIRGGLSEITAFNLSDEYIRIIDSFKNAEEIPPFLSEKAVELTALVRESAFKKSYPHTVRKAIHFIESHLYQKLKTSEVAEFCGFSADYLNTLFRKHTGKTVAAFIMESKLKESYRLINRGFSNSQIAYQLHFCSESHFISRFKSYYGATPGERRNGSGKNVQNEQNE